MNCAIGVLRFFFAAALLTATASAFSQKLTVVTLDNYATQPAINDSGEIIYVRQGDVISTWRGLVVTGVDSSNIGISNSGEIVYASGLDDSRVTSTVRGVLTSFRSFAPTIAATTGEVGFIAAENPQYAYHFYTTLQGQVEFLDQSIYPHGPGAGDVNDLGEVVFEIRRYDSPYTRIYSTKRGFLTPEGFTAIQPAINNYGEVVYTGSDGSRPGQIYSTERGQITFSEGRDCINNADLPDINNRGEVVFRAVLCSGDQSAGLYKLSLKPPKPPKGKR